MALQYIVCFSAISRHSPEDSETRIESLFSFIDRSGIPHCVEQVFHPHPHRAMDGYATPLASFARFGTAQLEN